MKASLQTIFGYSPDDLIQLRQGYLSPVLKKRVKNQLMFYVWQLPLVIVFSVGSSVYIASSSPSCAFVWAIFNIFLFLWPLREIARLRHDLAENWVETLTDYFYTEGGIGQLCYLVDTNHRRYRIGQFQHCRLSFLEGRYFGQTENTYTVYYLPRSKRVVAVDRPAAP